MSGRNLCQILQYVSSLEATMKITAVPTDHSLSALGQLLHRILVDYAWSPEQLETSLSPVDGYLACSILA